MKAVRQKTLLGVISAAMAALLLGQFFSAVDTCPPSTVTAVRYEGQPVRVRGVVIRQETVVTAERAGDWVPRVADGRKVASGQTLCALAQPSETAVAARLVRVLRAGADAAALPLVSRRQALRSAIRGLNAASGENRRGLSEQISGLLRGEGSGLSAQLERAEAALLTRSGGVQAAVTAPQAGMFTAEVDGLETVLTPRDPWREWPMPRAPVPERAVGRLITSDVWYFRTDREDLPEELAPGDDLTGVLENAGEARVTLTLEAVQGGQALLSCDTAMESVAALRYLTVRLPPETEPGVEIPSEALHTVDGAPGVWCLVGEAAVFKPVTVLEDLGDTLVVELDQSTTASLWPGDEIYISEP